VFAVKKAQKTGGESHLEKPYEGLVDDYEL
jgi:hypothetical protein